MFRRSAIRIALSVTPLTVDSTVDMLKSRKDKCSIKETKIYKTPSWFPERIGGELSVSYKDAPSAFDEMTKCIASSDSTVSLTGTTTSVKKETVGSAPETTETTTVILACVAADGVVWCGTPSCRYNRDGCIAPSATIVSKSKTHFALQPVIEYTTTHPAL